MLLKAVKLARKVSQKDGFKAMVLAEILPEGDGMPTSRVERLVGFRRFGDGCCHASVELVVCFCWFGIGMFDLPRLSGFSRKST